MHSREARESGGGETDFCRGLQLKAHIDSDSLASSAFLRVKQRRPAADLARAGTPCLLCRTAIRERNAMAPLRVTGARKGPRAGPSSPFALFSPFHLLSPFAPAEHRGGLWRPQHQGQDCVRQKSCPCSPLTRASPGQRPARSQRQAQKRTGPAGVQPLCCPPVVFSGRIMKRPQQRGAEERGAR